MFYPGMDRYYTPFIVPKEKKTLNTGERNDVLPEHNKNMTVIPQIMTNKADEFLRIASVLQEEYGYTEINLNLGCPSKTVVSKKRGAGFLAVPDQLDTFLDIVCCKMDQKQMKLSVKTRIGRYAPEEFAHLLEIFNQYPLSELIIHPRVQTDFYNNDPDLLEFSRVHYLCGQLKFPICYNGNIFSREDGSYIQSRFPKLAAVMLGRGLLVNPALAGEIKVRENGGNENQPSKQPETGRFSNDQDEKDERKRRYELYRRLREDYTSVLNGERNVLFKMKELWMYMSKDFTSPQRYWKKMKKAGQLSDFDHAVTALCLEQKLTETAAGLKQVSGEEDLPDRNVCLS